LTAYILTEAAENDLRSIIRYTGDQWGEVQLSKYITALEQGIADLANGKGNFKDMSALYPQLTMARCGHHYVFCLPRGDAPALIIAIFHERMNLMTRLKNRLESNG